MSKRAASEGPGEVKVDEDAKAPRVGVEMTMSGDTDPAGGIGTGGGITTGIVKKTGPRLPVIMYREGEPLHELKDYLTALDGKPQPVEVRIASHFLTSNNRQVRSRQLWGSDIYTSDSDLVAVLMHFGYVHHTINQPVRDILEIRVVVKPCEALSSYPSTPRNSIRSRAWNAPITGCSYTVEKAWVVTRMGSSYDLKASVEGIPAVAQTFAPMHLERIVTRSSVGAAAARHRMVQEVTVVFNLVNEPWHKYTPATICDRGLKPHDWTSSRLHTCTLYAESYQHRYELSIMGQDGENESGEKFRWSRCKRPMTAREMQIVGVPLPNEHKEVLAEGLLWEELVWGPTSVIVKGEKYPLIRIHFMDIEAPQKNEEDEE